MNINNVNNLINYTGYHNQQLNTPKKQKNPFVSESIYKQSGNELDIILNDNFDVSELNDVNANKQESNQNLKAEMPCSNNPQVISAASNLLFGYCTTSYKKSNFITALTEEKEEKDEYNNENYSFLSKTVPSSRKSFNILKLFKPGEILNNIVNKI